MLVDYIIAMSKAVCRFRELTALLGLLLDNIPIEGIKFCGCRGLRFILLLEEAQETALLLSFLRTLIYYDGNTLGKFFAEFYLLFKQLGDIEYIKQNAGLDSLPENLKELALLRLEYPDTPLKELGTYLDPPVGKSGVNHRLRRISEIADELREKE